MPHVTCCCRWNWWRPVLAAMVGLVMLMGPAGMSAADSGPRPNIVLILADDLGFSDLGCYGGEIETPHLDRLAAEGMRFSQFYNCALCGPSRAALLTGLHPHQVGISSWTGLLNDRCATLFELLQRAGYITGAVGRLDMVTADNWHEPAMIRRHVMQFLGSTGHTGPGNYFKDVRQSPFFRNGEPFRLPAEGAYKTDLITDFATEFIAAAATKDQPFFLYVSHYAPHWPLHAKPADMDKYRDRYRKLGWDEARAGRYRRLVERGVIPRESQLSPRDERVPAWKVAPHQEWEADRMAAYAGQVDSLDQNVGRILDALRRARIDEKTLVIFLSDNGASDQGLAGSLDKRGQTWRLDGTPTQVGNKPSIPPGGADTFVTAGPAWSNVSNTPFRRHKNTNHEGGIATPCIIRWPGVVKQTGSISSELAHITDVTATCLDVARVDYPARFHERHLLPLAGRSLWPVLKGEHREGHPSLCWSTSGCRAVRVGSWKLVSLKDQPWELYDLSVDRTELHNLVQQHPDRVQAMTRIFDTWSRPTSSKTPPPNSAPK